MEDRQIAIDVNFRDLGANAWLAKVDDVCEDHGFFEQLGREHCAGFLEAGNALLVTFENVQSVRENNIDAEPRGFAYARHDGWSHLALFSFKESWFRDRHVYDFFDRMVDEGFFDDFEKIVFHGGGDGASYAAAAFSVVAPGSTVIALRPQATLDAQMAGWDTRYKRRRKQNFNDRYGYAPEMIDGAQRVFIAFDPIQRLDACHAALFRKPHVTALPCALLGDDLDQAFDRMGIHDVLIKLAMDGMLDRRRFLQLLRARRYDPTYVRALVRRLIVTGHPKLARIICAYMIRRGHKAFFIDKHEELSPTQDIQT
ncbi:MAG: phosphoadenosine phosphosulfate reductase [Pseudomonadota bacterium]